jgi:hypothetical protein
MAAPVGFPTGIEVRRQVGVHAASVSRQIELSVARHHSVAKLQFGLSSPFE